MVAEALIIDDADEWLATVLSLERCGRDGEAASKQSGATICGYLGWAEMQIAEHPQYCAAVAEGAARACSCTSRRARWESWGQVRIQPLVMLRGAARAKGHGEARKTKVAAVLAYRRYAGASKDRWRTSARQFRRVKDERLEARRGDGNDAARRARWEEHGWGS